MYKVLKRDESLQDFNKSKIVDVLVHAGADYMDAVSLADKVEEWLPSVSTDNVIGHEKLRAKVLELLTALNPDLAQKFESFKK